MSMVGSFKTHPFVMPTCASPVQVLQLNIFTAIGFGARVEIIAMNASGHENVLAQSERIEGGSTEHNVTWMKPSGPQTQEWVAAGCAYENRDKNKTAPPDQCGPGQGFLVCNTTNDCLTPADPVTPGTCHRVQQSCIEGICQTGATGGEACGHWATNAHWAEVGSNLKGIGLPADASLALSVSIGAGDLYSMQVLC